MKNNFNHFQVRFQNPKKQELNQETLNLLLTGPKIPFRMFIIRVEMAIHNKESRCSRPLNSKSKI